MRRPTRFDVAFLLLGLGLGLMLGIGVPLLRA